MAGKRKILIVEDNSDLRRLYAVGLNQHGYEVKLAANGAEALDRIEQEKPDLLLLDLYMPIMNGWELLDKLNPPNQRAIPVIVISGHSREDDTRALPFVIGWLNKPITILELVQTIETLAAA